MFFRKQTLERVGARLRWCFGGLARCSSSEGGQGIELLLFGNYKNAKKSMERVGGIALVAPSALLGPGLRSTATGSRPRPFDSRDKTKISPLIRFSLKKYFVERVGGIEPPTKPWEGLVLPLNHTRRRFALYAGLAVFASLIFFVTPTHAQVAPVPVVPYHFDDNLISTGWTLKLPDGGNLTIFPGVLSMASDVSWSVSSDVVPTLPENTSQLGSLYRVTITGATTLNTTKWKLAAALPDATSYWAKSIWMYDLGTKTWTKLSSKLNGTTNKWQAGLVSLDAYVVVLQDTATEQGYASWYCKTSCSAKYPKLHAASNDFPVGSYVTVTNPTNNNSVKVKIISGWGQPEGRIIDLSWAAYNALKPTNKGVTAVLVTSKTVTPAPVVPVVPEAPLTVETIPALSVAVSGTGTPPTVSATSYQVIDAATNKVLAEKNSTTALPIASLTKLMTAMVFLDSQPTMNKIVTYTKADVTPYAYLRVRTGETLTNKDLFYSLIVGSANNAATTLARVTGMTREQFLAAMNTKAAGWGLTSTHFADFSGLNSDNVSSAADMAVIANHAFHDYPLIAKASTTLAYTFTTKNTKVKHTIKATDKLLTAKNGLTVTGGKTGFLDEAKYTYVLRTKNSQGAQVIVSLLAAPTSAARFSDAANLATWAWKNYTWS